MKLARVIEELIIEYSFEDLKSRFKSKYKIVKDAGYLKKGPAEDVSDHVVDKYKLKYDKSFFKGTPDDPDVKSRYFTNGSIGVLEIYFRGGGPTVLIGMKDKKTWEEIKQGI